MITDDYNRRLQSNTDDDYKYWFHMTIYDAYICLQIFTDLDYRWLQMITDDDNQW